MKNKIIIYVIAIIMILSSYISVFFWGRASIKPPPPDTITVIAKPIIKIDTMRIADTIIVKGDTVIICDTVKIGDLPWYCCASTDTFNIQVRSKLYPITFDLKRWIKGMDGGYEIYPEGKTFIVPDRPILQPFPIRPFCNVNADYLLATASTNNHFSLSSEIGLSIVGRVDLHLVAGFDNKVSGGAGIRYWLLR